MSIIPLQMLRAGCDDLLKVRGNSSIVAAEFSYSLLHLGFDLSFLFKQTSKAVELGLMSLGTGKISSCGIVSW